MAQLWSKDRSASCASDMKRCTAIRPGRASDVLVVCWLHIRSIQRVDGELWCCGYSWRRTEKGETVTK